MSARVTGESEACVTEGWVCMKVQVRWGFCDRCVMM